MLTRAWVSNLVLHEQPDKGRNVFEKLVEEGKESNYAIALLTPDDLLESGSLRARQNVILEIGYFIGKLGRERVRLLVRGDIEIPSDLHGILYTRYDEGGAWRISLLKEMQAVGIFVDIQSVITSF